MVRPPDSPAALVSMALLLRSSEASTRLERSQPRSCSERSSSERTNSSEPCRSLERSSPLSTASSSCSSSAARYGNAVSISVPWCGRRPMIWTRSDPPRVGYPLMSEFFTAAVLVSTISSGIRLATSYLYAAIGETFGQRSGVLNLGVDGVMLLGAFGAYYTVLKTGNLWLALVVAAGIGLIMGLAMAFASVTLQAEQGISGIGFYLFGLGMSDLLFQKLVGTPLPIQGFPSIHLPVLSDIPLAASYT